MHRYNNWHGGGTSAVIRDVHPASATTPTSNCRRAGNGTTARSLDGGWFVPLPHMVPNASCRAHCDLDARRACKPRPRHAGVPLPHTHNDGDATASVATHAGRAPPGLLSRLRLFSRGAFSSGSLGGGGGGGVWAPAPRRPNTTHPNPAKPSQEVDRRGSPGGSSSRVLSKESLEVSFESWRASADLDLCENRRLHRQHVPRIRAYGDLAVTINTLGNPNVDVLAKNGNKGTTYPPPPSFERQHDDGVANVGLSVLVLRSEGRKTAWWAKRDWNSQNSESRGVIPSFGVGVTLQSHGGSRCLDLGGMQVHCTFADWAGRTRAPWSTEPLPLVLPVPLAGHGQNVRPLTPPASRCGATRTLCKCHGAEASQNERQS